MRDISLYIHIPFCAQKCSYCDFAAYERLDEYFETYMAALEMELDMIKERYGALAFDTVYFGGGTPTHVPKELLIHFMEKLNRDFDLTACREYTVESNPGDISREYLNALKEQGVTRMSYGIQSLQNHLLDTLRRSHTAKEAYETVEETLKQGFEHCNVDFIYGLPGQSVKDIHETLEFLDRCSVDHVSIYGLQLEKGTYLYQQVEKGLISLPDDDIREEMYDALIEGCEKRGFTRYEISNFAKKDAYGIHNLRYWQGKEYLGIGAGAHGYIDGVRYENTPYVVPYFRKIECYELPQIKRESITAERAAEDYCFLTLRTKWGISIKDYEEQFHRSFKDDYGQIVDSLQNKGLIECTDEHVRLTREGTKYGNYVFSQFVGELT